MKDKHSKLYICELNVLSFILKKIKKVGGLFFWDKKHHTFCLSGTDILVLTEN